MAEILLKYYKYIRDIAGYEGKVDLATMTKVPSTKAAMEPDSEENIMIFKRAIEKITGEKAPDYNAVTSDSENLE